MTDATAARGSEGHPPAALARSWPSHLSSAHHSAYLPFMPTSRGRHPYRPIASGVTSPTSVAGPTISVQPASQRVRSTGVGVLSLGPAFSSLNSLPIVGLARRKKVWTFAALGGLLVFLIACVVGRDPQSRWRPEGPVLTCTFCAAFLQCRAIPSPGCLLEALRPASSERLRRAASHRRANRALLRYKQSLPDALQPPNDGEARRPGE